MTGRSIVVFGCFFPDLSKFALGLDFTTDGKYMALAERRNCKDCISIFACTSWQLVKVYIYNIHVQQDVCSRIVLKDLTKILQRILGFHRLYTCTNSKDIYS